MRCEDTAALAADYLAGTLPDETMAAVGAHVTTCKACRRELASLDETWQMLSTVSEPRPDSAAMRARFAAALDGYQDALADQNVTRRSPHAWLAGLWNARLAFQLATAAAVLLIGVTVGRLSAPTPATSSDAQLVAMRQELGDMRQMMTMALLQQQSAAERLEGVAWTGRIEQPGAELVSALLDTLRQDPNVNVRLATIDALKRFADQDIVRRAALDTLPRQPSPIVQIALIDFVLEASGAEAAPILRTLSQDATVIDTVRMHAARGLEQLGA